MTQLYETSKAPVTGPASGSGTARRSASRLFGWLALLLAVFTLAAYWPVQNHDFVAFDDSEYVVENPMVQGGLTWASVRWAFTTGYFSYWHPLTWLSHMVDVELFGKGPRGPHVVSVLIHTVNTLVLFALLRRLTGAMWRSAIVAALFALHPLHVESVAWIAERKDVLSGFFFLLTIWAYGNWAEIQRRELEVSGRPAFLAGLWSSVFSRWYIAALLLFTCALMSKPMVVTLPCVLLLLDFWPLQRWPIGGGRATAGVFARLLAEKLPFFALTAGACVTTVVAQRQNDVVQSLSEFTLSGRLENAVVSYARYLGKTFWPTELAFFYPHPGNWPALAVIAASLLMLAVSFGVVAWLRRFPFAATGWFWFVGMLVPTIGIVQVGGQSLADRYTYLPHVGLFVALVWGAGELWARGSPRRMLLGLCAAAAVVACGLRTRDQVGNWRDSERLFRHALAVTENNFFAHNNLGNVLVAAGKIDEAISHYERALAIRPRDDHATNNLGSVLLRRGQAEEAIPHLQRALELLPALTPARHALCNALFRVGRAAEAIPHLQKILSVEPRNSQVHGDLGVALLRAGRPEEALVSLRRAQELGSDDVEIQHAVGRSLLQLGRANEAVPHLQTALKTRPAAGELHYDLAIALFQSGRLPESISHFESAARLQPANAEVQSNLGWALLVLDRVDEAIDRFQAALRVDPAAAVAQTNLAGAWLRKGNAREAIACFESLLRQQPDHLQATTDLAWTFATWPAADVRNGARAVELATRANQISGGQDPKVLRTLAAAYAETGRFGEAAATAQRALKIAETTPEPELSAALQAQLKTYESGAAVRDPIALPGRGDRNEL